jgi:ADP-L-glycero-D-manno-heptose 6-epimerase
VLFCAKNIQYSGDNIMFIVTGGAGFIGSAIVWALNERGIDDIIVVDYLGCDEKWKNLTPLKFSDYIEKDDFRSIINDNPAKFADAEAIIHMGACSSTTETNASFLVDNNFNYSRDIAVFAAQNDIRLIYASSAATYGDGALGYADDEDAIDALRPLNMYGYSKQMFDQWVNGNGLFSKFTGLKFTNVFGSNEWHKGEMRSLVCKAYDQITETGKLQLFKSHKAEYADGEQMRDFLYIKDAVKMVLFFVDNPIGGLFNIGSGQAETWNTLANAIFAGMEKTPEIEYIDMPVHLRDKYQYYTQAEMSKLQNAGYDIPLTSLRDAVIDYVQNHLAQNQHLESTR